MAQWIKDFWKFLNQPDPSDVERIERWHREVEESRKTEEEEKEKQTTIEQPPHFLKSKQKGVKY